ncbi:MAG: FMN-binding glutamate synthase family protein [Phycisphaerales bacterium]|nr:FMN-binding glutamate synthase family protein [Phycisphaerae bacterium]NNF44982.1 FMN-binding glutamate synthase family protein [Phycisphaerales bacterium]NNM27768.1 FMN-binding glutamate synthase family protein [Phycisphaerales bacterium]
MIGWITLGVVGVAVLLLAGYDLLQRKHAILRNFPIIGHFRYWLEAVGPELRQYIVTDNDEERPFSRDQRRWVYASSKLENNYFGFGSDNEMSASPNYLIVKHSGRPLPDPLPGDAAYDPEHTLPCAKILGAARGRRHAFRPASIVNISAMSYGSLSAPAVEAMNKGCLLAGCLHNTGEGGVASHHQHGGELVWQIGTGYFGCRRPDGGFDLDRFKEVVAANPIRAIEVKLSQGAKPGIGGLLPAVKVTHEMAAIRGVPAGEDCISPARHSAFDDEDGLLDFVEMLAGETGLPVGIKSAVGDEGFWTRLADLMATTERGVDFISIDGGEGGTGAGPLVFTDHVAVPFKLGITRVFRIFAQRDLHRRVVFGGAGKLGFPAETLFAFAVGCDVVSVAREAMLAIGCIQAQRCHSNHCPTGVATQNKWLMRGLDPTLKSARLANYIRTLRKELLRLSRACGVCHPALITGAHLEILDGRFGSTTVERLFDYHRDWARPDPAERAVVEEIMGARCRDLEGMPA